MADAWVKHRERCPHCKYEYIVRVYPENDGFRAYCAACNGNRENLDIATYGAQLGLSADRIAAAGSSRFRQSSGARSATASVNGGACVHCALSRIGDRRKVSIIPRTWLEVTPTVQATLFSAVHSDAMAAIPTFSDDDLNGDEHDHVFHRQMHAYLGPLLTSEQDLFVRKHWLVPSCRQHNLARASHLESVPYLLHVFAFFMDAKGLRLADTVAETQSFLDVAKTAHVLLAAQAHAANAKAG